MITTTPSDYQNPFLARIKGVIREGPKDRELTLDDCLPLLTGFYETMGRENVRTMHIHIVNIREHLNTESMRYTCKDETKLSQEICGFLTANGVPVELYQIMEEDDDDYSNRPGPVRTVGVTLKLYR